VNNALVLEDFGACFPLFVGSWTAYVELVAENGISIWCRAAVGWEYYDAEELSFYTFHFLLQSENIDSTDM